MEKSVNKHGKSEFLYGVFALLFMLLFMLCLVSVTIFGIKKFMQPIKKDVVVDGFHWERSIKADETIATGDNQTHIGQRQASATTKMRTVKNIIALLSKKRITTGKTFKKDIE